MSLRREVSIFYQFQNNIVSVLKMRHYIAKKERIEISFKWMIHNSILSENRKQD